MFFIIQRNAQWADSEMHARELNAQVQLENAKEWGVKYKDLASWQEKEKILFYVFYEAMRQKALEVEKCGAKKFEYEGSELKTRLLLIMAMDVLAHLPEAESMEGLASVKKVSEFIKSYEFSPICVNDKHEFDDCLHKYCFTLLRDFRLENGQEPNPWKAARISAKL